MTKIFYNRNTTVLLINLIYDRANINQSAGNRSFGFRIINFLVKAPLFFKNKISICYETYGPWSYINIRKI